jgi:DNA-binding SARP family transcriptional activator/serine/threonine protein kinase
MPVRILGVVGIDAEGVAIRLGGPRQRRLLAALAVNEGEVLSIDRLCGIVFAGEEPPRQANRVIATYVSRLRKSLGDAGLGDSLERREPGYVLELGAALDVRQFAELASRAREHLAQGNAAETLAATAAALDLWRGEPLSEFTEEDWTRSEVARLTELRVLLDETQIEAHLALGDNDDALSELKSVIERQPFRETPRELQMLALYRAGRQVEALDAFQDFRTVLAEELGLDPSPMLQELERRILTQDPSLEVSAPTRPLRSYRLGEIVSKGHWGDLYRGVQPAIGREVAVRVVGRELADDPTFIRLFEREAERVSQVDHPHLVPLDDYWRDGEGAYLVTRWHRGGSLADSLEQGSGGEEAVVRIMEQIGGALGAAHNAEIVHGDVRPDNILLDDSGNAYLTDFAIAMASHRPAPHDFAAPEVVDGREATRASDVFSLGLIARAVLGGHGCSEMLSSVIDTATARQPELRYRTASEMLAALDAAGSTHRAPQKLQPANPYRGLRAFGEADAGEFFGRGELVGQIVDHMASEARLTAVVGPSGCGKSSAIWAGLVPALRNGRIAGSEDWLVVGFTPGAYPFEELEAALLRVAVNPPPTLIDQLTSSERGLTRAVKRVLPDALGDVLLIIDQFEELFTLVADPDVTSAFIGGLAAALVDPRSRLRIVISLRADFYDRPLSYEAFGRLLADSVVNVMPLSSDALAEAITEPAVRLGCSLEPGLAAKIVADTESQAGALPLVQFALTELFDKRNADTLTIASYDAIGGVSGAMVRRAELIYGELDAAQQVAARRMFPRLVTLGEGLEDTEHRAIQSELVSLEGVGDLAHEVLDAYGLHRLVTFDRDPISRAPTVELAHGALIREWARLRSWLDESRSEIQVTRELESAAVLWSAGGKNPDDLLRGARFKAASDWSVEHSRELGDDTSSFLDASSRLRSENANNELLFSRRLGIALCVTAAAFAVVVISGLRTRRQLAGTLEQLASRNRTL